MRNYLFVLLIAMPLVVILLPTLLVWYAPPISIESRPQPVPTISVETETPGQVPIKVYRTAKKTIETIPIESYIEGVVAAEMPAEFEVEALKAQAMAARTYIVRRLQAGHFDDVPQGAQVLDTVKHQAFLDPAELKARWKEQYEWKRERIRQAVKATAGMVLTYQGLPIDATFFSTSNGFTENADEYWEKPIPYLKSVASPWDSESPRYVEKITMQRAVFEQKLGVALDVPAMSGSDSWYRILTKTTGNRIGKIRIGTKEFSGREFRERLGLNSAAFTLQLKGNTVEITTRGYGHGVGMSQWGANGMAKAGKSAEQIVKYFYQGIALENYQNVLKS